MKNQRPQSPKINTHHYKYGVSFAWAFTGTLLVASSVAQASDMQIYAVPTAGKKTIVMMLDTSGSMGGTDTGQTGTRLTRLKAGMNAFLDSNDATLSNVSVGLGHYSLGSRRGKILVPAAPLGVVGSAQRSTLRTAVDGLTASGLTPTAHAYAEAAAYLMGTSTRSEAEIQVDVYKKEVVTTTYYRCDSLSTTDFTNNIQSCSSSGWTLLGSTPPSDLGDYTNNGSDVFYKKEMQLGPNAESGFADSVESSKSGTNYISPLPAAADRVSCDGQGVYILSDGAANVSSNARAKSVMSAALDSTSFTCPSSGGLNTGGAASWNCMGEFAKKLFDKTTFSQMTEADSAISENLNKNSSTERL